MLSQSGISPVGLSLRMFVLFSIVYLFTWAGHYTTADGSSKLAWTKALLSGHVVAFLPNGDPVSRYGIGHSLLAIPSIALAELVNKVTGIHAEPALYTLLFIVNGALFLALLTYYLAQFYPARSVVTTVLIAGLATIWWPYTKLDFSEPLVLTLAFLGFLLMRFGHPFWGMLMAAFTLTIRPDSITVVAPIAVWYLLTHRSIKSLLEIALATAPSIVLILVSNYVRYHSIVDRGYPGERFSNPWLVGLYGILLSSGKSIFLFSPPLVLGLLGWKAFASRPHLRADAWLFLSVCIVQVCLFAKWWGWSGEDDWGVRFVIPGVLMLSIPMIEVLNRRALVIPIVTLGVAVQLLAVLIPSLAFLQLLRKNPLQREALYVHTTDRVDFDDEHFDPRYSQILGNWIILRYLLHVPPKPGNPQDVQYVGTPLQDTISPEAWASVANWDFVWNLRRSKPPLSGH